LRGIYPSFSVEILEGLCKLIKEISMIIPDKDGDKFSVSGIICGGFVLHVSQQSVGIWNVQIDYRFRGMKLGQKMMQECLEFIFENYPDVSYIYLRVSPKNAVARHIYEKLGFTYTDEDKEFVHSFGMRLDKEKYL
jgi:ribosomal protein S18 acetylase RimI-like enzyme